MQVAEILPEFAAAFPFDEFNAMQRRVLPTLLETDENVVASAPTASGKTALAELAICRTLRAGGTALFIAPLRAVTNEKEAEWDRFEALGYSVYVVTGERDLSPRQAERADVLVMTPEKVDSATRKYDSERYGFVTNIDCCVIDEVHLLDSDRRGSVLEVIISRLRRLCDPRIVALSATLPNIEDVATWLDASAESTFQFDTEYRPVELHTAVEPYTPGDNAFADKYRRLYRALDLAEPHLQESGQALIFVASRRDTVAAARKAREEIRNRDLSIGPRGDLAVHNKTKEITSDHLRESVLDGIGFHHAGMSREEKDRIESWFRKGDLSLLFSTTTLAWGVNLPARCVIIRDTKLHDPLEGEVPMSPIDILQMLGRAGRPDYDDTGYGYVICEPDEAEYYQQLLEEGVPIESGLADDLGVHLVAEIVLGTISNMSEVMEWLRTTFYYVWVQNRPSQDGADELRRQVRATLEDLISREFVSAEGDHFSPTALARLTSEYYIQLKTAERFHSLANQRVSAQDALLAVARAGEFESVRSRRDEEAAIRDILGPTDHLEDNVAKVMAILNASIRGSVPDPLKNDAWVIRQNAHRLLAALHAFTGRFGDPRDANCVRRLEARLDYGVTEAAVALTAIEGVGGERAKRLAAAGIQTPEEVRAAGISGLTDAGLSTGIAERILANADALPAIMIDWGPFPDQIDRHESALYEVVVGTTTTTAKVAVEARVNGVVMTETTGHLSNGLTVPVGVFGAADERLEYTIEVVCPELPLAPVTETRTVHVT